MWVLTETVNEAARRTYESAGGTSRGPQLMLDWRFGESAAASRSEGG
jgi:hypothetical protein